MSVVMGLMWRPSSKFHCYRQRAVVQFARTLMYTSTKGARGGLWTGRGPSRLGGGVDPPRAVPDVARGHLAAELGLALAERRAGEGEGHGRHRAVAVAEGEDAQRREGARRQGQRARLRQVRLRAQRDLRETRKVASSSPQRRRRSARAPRRGAARSWRRGPPPAARPWPAGRGGTRSTPRRRRPAPAPVWKSNLQPDFNVSVIERFDTSSSAGLRELDESDRSVQKSAESTAM